MTTTSESIEGVSPPVELPPEGVKYLGPLDRQSLETVKNLHGGGDYHVTFAVHPLRRILPAISSFNSLDDFGNIILRSERSNRWVGKEKAPELRGALKPLEAPLLLSKLIGISVHYGVVPPSDVQRSTGGFHQEKPWTTLFSDNEGLMTDFVVDRQPEGSEATHRVVSSDVLFSNHGLTPVELDDMSTDEMNERGLELWKPPVNEVILTREALHRSVPNTTGEAQSRLFGRGMQLKP